MKLTYYFLGMRETPSPESDASLATQNKRVKLKAYCFESAVARIRYRTVIYTACVDINLSEPCGFGALPCETFILLQRLTSSLHLNLQCVLPTYMLAYNNIDDLRLILLLHFTSRNRNLLRSRHLMWAVPYVLKMIKLPYKRMILGL